MTLSLVVGFLSHVVSSTVMPQQQPPQKQLPQHKPPKCTTTTANKSTTTTTKHKLSHRNQPPMQHNHKKHQILLYIPHYRMVPLRHLLKHPCLKSTAWVGAGKDKVVRFQQLSENIGKKRSALVLEGGQLGKKFWRQRCKDHLGIGVKKI